MQRDDLYTVYPSHIYDPVRRAIATEIMSKEVAKLIGYGGGEALVNLRQKVNEWFDGIPEELAPVHDFWSLFELLLLAKTKRLSRFVTAANVNWRREARPIDSLRLAWMPFVEDRPQIFGPGPWLIGDLRAKFKAHPELHAEIKEYVERYYAHYKFDREAPILVIERPEDLILLDGNGRLFWALTAGKTEVNCWIGSMSNEPPRDFWVSTGLQRRLCYDILENETIDPELSNAALIQLRRQLETNEVARINYGLWVQKRLPQLTAKLSL